MADFTLTQAFAVAPASQDATAIKAGFQAVLDALDVAKAGQSAVKTLTITGTPTGGTFTLSGTNPLTGVSFTTAAIARNAIASAVASAVALAMGVDSSLVVGTGGALPGTPVVLTFAASIGNLGAITANSASLTGGTSPTAAVANTTTGERPAFTAPVHAGMVALVTDAAETVAANLREHTTA